MALEHEEITEQIIGAAFEVHSVLGYGFLEKVYQRAMQVELILRGLTADLSHWTKVVYKNLRLLINNRCHERSAERDRFAIRIRV
jgi:GxxExxY protein